MTAVFCCQKNSKQETHGAQAGVTASLGLGQLWLGLGVGKGLVLQLGLSLALDLKRESARLKSPISY